MSDELKKLIELASQAVVTPQHREQQRRSFAYGNTHFENEHITHEHVAKAAEELANGGGAKD